MDITITNDCCIECVSEPYLPLIKEAIAAYTDSLGNLVTSVRLMGSVARGEAFPNQSDIDFVAFTSAQPGSAQLQKLQRHSAELTTKYPIVSKVDLETELDGHVDPAREFIFRTDSICISGVDSYPERTVVVSNEILVRQNTPSLQALLTNYREGVIKAAMHRSVQQWSRWVGKDLLKCFRGYLIAQHGIYEKTARMIQRQLVEHYPYEKAIWDELLKLYLEPTTRKGRILRALRMAEHADKRMKELHAVSIWTKREPT